MFDYGGPTRPIWAPGGNFVGGQRVEADPNVLPNSPQANPGNATAGMSALRRPGYFAGGNVGNSAPGSNSPTGNPPIFPAGFNSAEYPWTQDTSVQWGGGPGGYLPIGYQPQSFGYYAQADQGGNVAQGPYSVQGANGRWRPVGGYAQMAPWEQRYARDTWTQNYDPNQPGYINTRNPGNYPNVRG